ncbi:unnamed protein product [Euphydryas editha]|uniref:Uncharacterized protein n=1 Tax=Euphydryas editha TaxID=104508 RepID=A0AAU9TNY7_EUPED|nr:unnamed protein product [Euphydryas editha]
MGNYSFNIYHQNTRGLRTKTHGFKRNLLLNSYDVVSLTETWLLDGISNNELFDDRYVVWRRDRNYVITQEKLGGGVLFAAKKKFMAVERPEWSSTAEDLWVTLSCSKDSRKSRKIHFCTVYLCSANLDIMNKEKNSEDYISNCVDENQLHPTIDEEQVEVSVNILNFIDHNRINFEDPDFIPETNEND